MEWIAVVAVVLLVVVAACLVSLQWELRRLTRRIRQVDPAGSNQRLTISSGNRQVTELAAAVNELYEAAYQERGRHTRAMEELRDSMANISHDLRTPLTSIIGYVKLLQKEGDLPGEAGRYLSVIAGKAESLHRLIGSLFVLARLDAGAYGFELERIDAGAILAEELAGFYPALTEGGRQPEITLAEQPLWIIADRSAVTRIFSNLLNNMIRHGGEHLKVTGGTERGKAVFAFSNDAGDLREEDVSRLFQRFFTADRTRSGENTGLGLSIVKEFAEHTNGKIECLLDDKTVTFRLEWEISAG